MILILQVRSALLLGGMKGVETRALIIPCSLGKEAGNALAAHIAVDYTRSCVSVSSTSDPNPAVWVTGRRYDSRYCVREHR